MKFSCEKHLLQAAVSAASRAASAKSPISVLEGLLIQAGAGVRVTGYDLKKGIYMNIEADVVQPGSAVLMTAKLFSEMMRLLPDGICAFWSLDYIITVEVGDDSRATVKCGQSEYSFMALPASDYPELPDVDVSEAIAIPQKTLRSMIDESIFAVSTNESRPVYMGSLFELEGGRLTMVSVDGYRMAIRREDVKGGTDGMRFIIPGSALLDVERLCGDTDEEVLLNVGTKHSSFTIGGTVVVSRKLEGDFLNYKKSLPENFRHTVTVLREDMLGATDRVSLVVDEKLKSPVRLIFGDGRIDFFCNTPLGKAGDVCPCDGEGGETEIGFNDKYLRDALRAAPAKELCVCINTGSSPCVIKAADGGDGFVYMILPVRLKAGE